MFKLLFEIADREEAELRSLRRNSHREYPKYLKYVSIETVDGERRRVALLVCR